MSTKRIAILELQHAKCGQSCAVYHPLLNWANKGFSLISEECLSECPLSFMHTCIFCEKRMRVTSRITCHQLPSIHMPLAACLRPYGRARQTHRCSHNPCTGKAVRVPTWCPPPQSAAHTLHFNDLRCTRMLTFSFNSTHILNGYGHIVCTPHA